VQEVREIKVGVMVDVREIFVFMQVIEKDLVDLIGVYFLFLQELLLIIG
jgi:hypothetical protein